MRHWDQDDFTSLVASFAVLVDPSGCPKNPCSLMPHCTRSTEIVDLRREDDNLNARAVGAAEVAKLPCRSFSHG